MLRIRLESCKIRICKRVEDRIREHHDKCQREIPFGKKHASDTISCYSDVKEDESAEYGKYKAQGDTLYEVCLKRMKEVLDRSIGDLPVASVDRIVKCG